MQKKNIKILKNILKEIKNNPRITQEDLAIKNFYSIRTIRRYIKILKNSGKIESISYGKSHYWKIK